MSGSYGSPYRAPCGGFNDPPKIYFGCNQHHDPDAAHIAISTLTTIDPATGIAPVCQVGQFAEPAPVNTWASAGTFIDLSRCRKFGFKPVFAMKVWHGRFGFGDDDGCLDGDGNPVYTGPRSTKYLIKAMHGTKTATQVAGGVSQTWEWGRTYSVNRYSGKVVLSSDIQTHHFHGDASYNDAGELVAPEVNYDDDGTDDHLIALCTTDYHCGAYTGELAGGMLNTPLEDIDPSQPDYIYERTATQSVDSIVIHFRRYTDEPDTTDPVTGDPVPFNNSNEVYNVTITLGGEYTSADVNDDIDALLAYWPLNNDILYPWRMDGQCTEGPLVAYYEGPWNTPDQFTEVGWTDASQYTGDVIGAPHTQGQGGFFDFRCRGYNDDGSFACYGQGSPDWANDAWVPVTHWVDRSLKNHIPPEAHRFFDPATQTMTAGKIAKIIPMLVPSHNFARPCGDDVTAIDYSTVDCSDDGSGGFVNETGDLRWPSAAACAGQWDDDQPKGDWCLLTWNFNHRDYGIDATVRPTTGTWSAVTMIQHCSEYTPCYPAVACISPNGETWANGETIALPAITCDDIFGARIQMGIKVMMADPLYQRTRTCTIVGSPATIGDDETPFEECRASVPAGAPALPSGAYVGCLSVANINAGVTAGNQISPPSDGGCFELPTPWFYAEILLGVPP
jgi:hypothetical protein